jgi:hypothetical protein
MEKAMEKAKVMGIRCCWGNEDVVRCVVERRVRTVEEGVWEGEHQ